MRHAGGGVGPGAGTAGGRRASGRGRGDRRPGQVPVVLNRGVTVSSQDDDARRTRAARSGGQQTGDRDESCGEPTPTHGTRC